MFPVSRLDVFPEEEVDYRATVVDPRLHSHVVGSGGQVEIGFLGRVAQFGDMIWFIVVVNTADMPAEGDFLTVRFTPAAYFKHNDPPRGQLYPDARFYVVPGIVG